MLLSEIKTYIVVMSFCIKVRKQRTQACSLRHSIKKECFLFRANWTCLSRAGGNPPPLPPLFATRLFKTWLYDYSKCSKQKSGDGEESDDLPQLKGDLEKIIHAIIKRC